MQGGACIAVSRCIIRCISFALYNFYSIHNRHGCTALSENAVHLLLLSLLLLIKFDHGLKLRSKSSSEVCAKQVPGRDPRAACMAACSRRPRLRRWIQGCARPPSAARWRPSPLGSGRRAPPRSGRPSCRAVAVAAATHHTSCGTTASACLSPKCPAVACHCHAASCYPA